MQPADFFRAVEIGERARDAQHAVIAARGQLHGLGRIAQQFLTLAVRLRDGFQQRCGSFGIDKDPRQPSYRRAFVRMRAGLGQALDTTL